MSEENTNNSPSPDSTASDGRHHMDSLLMRESLVDKDLMAATNGETVRMLPNAKVVKIGGRSIFDRGRSALIPLADTLGKALEQHKLILGTGGGARTRHVYSIGIDLGLPTGVLAQLSIADALGSAHILGTLLAPHGVVAIPPEIFGHLLPFFIRAAPGVIFNGDPPYALWEHPPALGRIPPHRTDVGSYLLAECFGCERLILVKDVDGLYTADPKQDDQAKFIPEISVDEIKDQGITTLPFEEVLLDLLPRGRLMREMRIVNGLDPDQVTRAINGEAVGTRVYA